MDVSRHLDQESSAVQAHLTIMQNVIQRMAENSRYCKIWCITLVSAIMVLVARTDEPRHALIALVPIFLFWALDAYYLALERGFRDSYEAFVARIHGSEVRLVDLYRVVPAGKSSMRFIWALFRSVSTLPFYVLITATILLAWQFVF